MFRLVLSELETTNVLTLRIPSKSQGLMLEPTTEAATRREHLYQISYLISYLELNMMTWMTVPWYSKIWLFSGGKTDGKADERTDGKVDGRSGNGTVI